MEKKGKKAAKQQQAAADGGDGGRAKKKVGPGKARRERAAKIRDLVARIEALAVKTRRRARGSGRILPA